MHAPVTPPNLPFPERVKRLSIVQPSSISSSAMHKLYNSTFSHVSQHKPKLMSENQDRFLDSTKSVKYLSMFGTTFTDLQGTHSNHPLKHYFPPLKLGPDFAIGAFLLPSHWLAFTD